MRFVILIQTNPEVAELFSGLSDEDRRAAYQVYWDVENDLTESGELVDSKAIDGDAQKYVRRGDDGPVITDADTAEVVTGYYLVDVDDGLAPTRSPHASPRRSSPAASGSLACGRRRTSTR